MLLICTGLLGSEAPYDVSINCIQRLLRNCPDKVSGWTDWRLHASSSWSIITRDLISFTSGLPLRFISRHNIENYLLFLKFSLKTKTCARCNCNGAFVTFNTMTSFSVNKIWAVVRTLNGQTSCDYFLYFATAPYKHNILL